jgi:hypothetical protein
MKDYFTGYSYAPSAVAAFEFVLPVRFGLAAAVYPVKIIFRAEENIGPLDTLYLRGTDILDPETDVCTVIADLDYLYSALQAVVYFGGGAADSSAAGGDGGIKPVEDSQ